MRRTTTGEGELRLWVLMLCMSCCLLLSATATRGGADDASNISSQANAARSSAKASEKLDALNKLLTIDDAKAAAQVVDILKSDAVLVTLSQLHNPDCDFAVPAKAFIGPLLEIIQAPSSDDGIGTWWVAARILGKSGDAKIADPLISKLHFSISSKPADYANAVVCCYALGDLRSESAVSPLKSVLALKVEGAKGEEDVRYAAAFALWRIGTKDARKALSNELLGPNALYAIAAIQSGDPKDAMPCLVDGLVAPYIAVPDVGGSIPAGFISTKDIDFINNAMSQTWQMLPKTLQTADKIHNPIFPQKTDPIVHGESLYVAKDIYRFHGQWKTWWERNSAIAFAPVSRPATLPAEAAEVDSLVAAIEQQATDADKLVPANKLLGIETPYAAARFIEVIDSIRLKDAEPRGGHGGGVGSPLVNGDNGGLGLVAKNSNLVQPLIKAIEQKLKKDPRQGATDVTVHVYLLGQLNDQSAVPTILKALATMRTRDSSKCPFEYAWALGSLKDSRAVQPLAAFAADADTRGMPVLGINNVFEALCRIGTKEAFRATGMQILNQNDGAYAIAALAAANNDQATAELIDALSRHMPQPRADERARQGKNTTNPDPRMNSVELKRKEKVVEELGQLSGHPDFGNDVTKWHKWLKDKMEAKAATQPAKQASK